MRCSKVDTRIEGIPRCSFHCKQNYNRCDFIRFNIPYIVTEGMYKGDIAVPFENQTNFSATGYVHCHMYHSLNHYKIGRTTSYSPYGKQVNCLSSLQDANEAKDWFK